MHGLDDTCRVPVPDVLCKYDIYGRLLVVRTAQERELEKKNRLQSTSSENAEAYTYAR